MSLIGIVELEVMSLEQGDSKDILLTMKMLPHQFRKCICNIQIKTERGFRTKYNKAGNIMTVTRLF